MEGEPCVISLLYSMYTLCTQSLWRTLHNQDDNIAQTAFRVLGKFGGSNRKMLEAPQKVCGGIEDPGLWMHYVLLRRWGIYCTLVQYSTYTYVTYILYIQVYASTILLHSVSAV